MKKFIIIDHSLANFQGHHYECSISVAEAAARVGYEPIIVANQALPAALHPENIKIIPAFEVDWFGNSTIKDKLPFGQRYIQNITNFFQQLSLDNLAQNIQSALDYQLVKIKLTKPQWQLFLEKVQGSTARLGSGFQKDLQLLQYIPFSNTVWGIFKIIIGLLRFILQAIAKLIGRIWLKLFDFQPTTFRETLAKVLEEIKVSSGDLIFIHTIGIEQLEQLLSWLESGDRLSLPQYHIMLRRDIEDPLVTQAKGIGLPACLERFYQSKLWPEKVSFYTDTEELVERYNSLSPVKFRQIPVPFRQEKLKQRQPIKDQNSPFQIVYLGDARREKGYHHLPEVVAALWNDYLGPGKVKFTVQSNFSIPGGEPGILTARLNLEQYPEDRVKLIKEAMDAEGYYQLLAEADLLIIPYDVDSYRYRTSGVFTESLAAGKPVVVPANSWLATQVDKRRARIYDSPQDIAQGVIKIIENLDEFTQAASQFSLTWRQKHSPDTLIKCLLSEHNFSEVNQTNNLKLPSRQQAPKILYIARGDGFLKKDSQGQINLSHLQYLSLCGYQISAIFYPLDETLRGDNFTNFVRELGELIKSYPFRDSWFLNYSNVVSFPAGLERNNYVQKVYAGQSSLARDLIDVNSLDLPASLARYLQAQNLDAIFIDRIASWMLVDKLGLAEIPVICQMSQLYAYQYAINNNCELEPTEFKLECELLNKCRVILGREGNQLEKVSQISSKPLCYLLPPTIPLSNQGELAAHNQIIDFIWRSRRKNYEQVMNDACANILGKRALALQSSPESKKIAILYPWGDILARKAGASKRVGLLIDYLSQKNYQIWLFTAGDNPEILESRVRYTFYRQDFENLALVKQVYRSSYDVWLESQQLNQSGNFQVVDEQMLAEIAQDWRLNMYYQFRFDPHFIRWIEQITDWADVIILEYPFWAKTVSKFCQQKQIKLIITAHDAIYKQVKEDRAIRKILLAEEISSLKQADELISVCQEDGELFSQYGLNSIVVPNPVALPEKDLTSPEKISPATLKKYPWLEQNYCLFIGSNHFPNVEAVKQIRGLAFQYSQKQDRPPCKFIVVGGCCEPEESDNFIALGQVEFELLTTLYPQARLIISPMLSGTGASLKVIEAMAYGKVIVGTKIAFRGYPVESEVNCLVWDEITDYPQVINQLLLQPEQVKMMGKKAQEFAQSYDFRHLYPTYERVISAEG
jgi:glycosyltransferase involved in cell wall biosynthesis